MDDEKIKGQIGANIAERRKAAGMTQAGLAEKINYSDKAVSKWERGESVPDVLTMIQLAQLFGVTVNDLLQSPAKANIPATPPKPQASRGIIQGLSATLVWFVALFFYVILSAIDIRWGWVCFVYAVPVTAIVLLSLRSAWRNFSWNKVLISVIVWGALASIYASVRIFLGIPVLKIFLLGIPGQVAVILWFRMFRVKEPEKREEELGADGE